MEVVRENNPIKIILVDDHTIIRDGIKALLKNNPEIEIIGEAASGKELIELLPVTKPDVVMMDLNMPEMDGFETMAYLTEKFDNIKVLVLSMMDHEINVAKIMDAGARGYLLKNTGQEELVSSLKIVANGGFYICAAIALNLLKKTQNQYPKLELVQEDTQTRNLSQREIEILKLIADGLTNAEIADKIFTSKRTVETHRQNIIEKTKTKNTAALIKYALSKGLIN